MIFLIFFHLNGSYCTCQDQYAIRLLIIIILKFSGDNGKSTETVALIHQMMDIADGVTSEVTFFAETQLRCWTHAWLHRCPPVSHWSKVFVVSREEYETILNLHRAELGSLKQWIVVDELLTLDCAVDQSLKIYRRGWLTQRTSSWSKQLAHS